MRRVLILAGGLMLGLSACGGGTETVTLQRTVATGTNPVTTTQTAGPPDDAASAISLLCDDGSGEHSTPTVEPTQCTVFGRDGSFAGGVDLHDLRWQAWGQPTATAVGTECGFRAKCDGAPVQVTATRVRNGCGRKVYALLRSTNAELGSVAAHPPLCPN